MFVRVTANPLILQHDFHVQPEPSHDLLSAGKRGERWDWVTGPRDAKVHQDQGQELQNQEPIVRDASVGF